MAPSAKTVKTLGIVSGNVCAFPDCIAPLYDFDHDKLVGQVCHIKAENRKGPRYDRNQSKEERQHFDNLIMMCRPHHAIIDDEDKLSTYTVEMLTQLKRDHERRSYNLLPTVDFLEGLVARVLETQAAKQDRISAEPVFAMPRVGINHHMTTDTYDVWVRLHNDGEKPIRDFRIEVEVPNAYAVHASGIVHTLVPEHSRGDVALYRRTSEREPDFALYPGDISPDIFSIDFQVRWDQYKQPSTAMILVTVYAGDTRVSEAYLPIESLLNIERVAAFRELAQSLGERD